jgi:membrane carboxypeptidase/penicillin-binding protein PbpC
LLDLTAAYDVFANGGEYRAPFFVRRVEERGGRVIYEAPPAETRRVFSPQVAHLVTSILADNTARAPAFGEQSPLRLSRPAAAKTGTTTDWRDNWTVGYTPELVAGVWVGNADNRPMREVSGIAGAAPIWHDFMEEALKGMPAGEFREPPGLVRAEVCPLSGERPSPDCPERRTEVFLAGSEPRETCERHEVVAVCRVSGQRATPACPKDGVVRRVFTSLPGELMEWGREHGVVGPPTEACALHRWAVGDGGGIAGGTGSGDQITVRLSAPDPGSTLQISPALPRDVQRLALAAAASGRVASVEFYRNGGLLGVTTGRPFRYMWPLEPGEHTFRAVAVGERGERAESAPVTLTVVK